MKTIIQTLLLPATLAACIAQPSWADTPPTGGTISGSVAVYNAAQVRDNHGMITVPAGKVTYTAKYSALPVGTIFNVSLPTEFEFTTDPSLTTQNGTMTFVSIGNSGKTAKFVVTGEEVQVGDTIVLSGYRVKGATALETIVPAGSGPILYMQAVGIDLQPLAFHEFASDGGLVATFNGNSLIVDMSSPSDGKKFYLRPVAPSNTQLPDALTVQLGSVTITAETGVMAPNGDPNAVSSKDTATVQLPGFMFSGLTVFGSTSASCSAVTYKGSLTSTVLSFPNLPINKKVYLCVKGSGTQLVKLMGYPDTETTFGFQTGYLVNSHPDDDYLTSGNVGFQTSAQVCYALAPPTNLTCLPEFYNYFVAAKE